ncbi:Cardiolipin synthetase [Chitinispirillum alkaliphilum]|nr:Cardiolipin synthetase [Chitinispirillum alkaliphilum]
MLLVGVAVVLQLTTVALLSVFLRQNYLYLFLIFELLAIIEVISIISKNQSSAFSTSWIVIILVSPVFGYLLYLLWGKTRARYRRSWNIKQSGMKKLTTYHNDKSARNTVFTAHPRSQRIIRYLENEGFPLYQHASCKYFDSGELLFEEMLKDIRDAKSFIFISYFIIQQGKLWSSFFDILKEKVAAGVEIRVMFDDLGSIMTVSRDFITELKKYGIDAVAFNPVHKFLSRPYLNYRNHQKIVVIDGTIGYTGGVNLADEYANLYPRFGHWKDTGIRLQGDAVFSLCMIFLQMWKTQSGVSEDYEKYRPQSVVRGDGFYQPFSDGPVTIPHNPAEGVYHQIIGNANKYVYIMTPYLVIEETMVRELCSAAHSGVDVRIITPKNYDKWYVHKVTQSNYKRLLAAGVRIYEYTPGYIHAKTILSDDEVAVIGTINMDYRSFYLHFENAVLLCGVPAIGDIKKDMLKTFSLSEEMSLDYWQKRPLKERALQAVLRLLGPLL